MLYDWAFDTYAKFSLSEGERVQEVPVIGGTEAESAAVLDGDVCLCLPKSANVELGVRLPRFVFASVPAGAAAGELLISADGVLVYTAKLRWEGENPSAQRMLPGVYPA